MTTGYPKIIEYSTRPFLGLTPSAKNFLAILKEKISLRMLDEYELEITYPTNMVKEVRIVNVDDKIFRLDFVDHADYHWCVFPNVPWCTRAFFEERWPLCRSKAVSDGIMLISYERNSPGAARDFREEVFDAANSGKYGSYADDISEFNEEVEAGFSDGGREWTSKNGSLHLTQDKR